MSTRFTFQRLLRTAAVAAAVLAAGCGGGGGAPPPLQPELIQITATNQDDVARATVTAFFGIRGVGSLPVPARSDGSSDAAVVRAAGKALAAARSAANKVAPLAVHQETVPCAVSGTMTVTVNDADNNLVVSPGDVLTVFFVQCRDSPEATIDGTIRMTFTHVAQTASSFEMSGRLEFQQLAVREADYSASMNGAIDANYRDSVDAAGTRTVQITATVAAGGLVSAASTPVVSAEFTYDVGFRMVSVDTIPSTPTAQSTHALDGTVLVSLLGGRIRIATDAPIHDNWTDPYPDSGQVTVTGRDSRLRLTVLSTETVRIELDANGDGTFEAAHDVAWNSLLP